MADIASLVEELRIAIEDQNAEKVNAVARSAYSQFCEELKSSPLFFGDVEDGIKSILTNTWDTSPAYKDLQTSLGRCETDHRFYNTFATLLELAELYRQRADDMQPLAESVFVLNKSLDKHYAKIHEMKQPEAFDLSFLGLPGTPKQPVLGKQKKTGKIYPNTTPLASLGIYTISNSGRKKTTQNKKIS
jgi:hypothetical protein